MGFTTHSALSALAAFLVGSSVVHGAPTAHVKRTTAPAKRGLCYNNAAWSTLFGGDGSQVSWQYNWDSIDNGANPALEYVPMLWGTSADHVNAWPARATAAIAAGSKHFLGFNEPDNSGESNLTPQQAATAWMTYMQPQAGKGIKLGGPAITGSPTGLTWLSQFNALCTGCTIDFQPVHWYDTATNYGWFTSFMKQAYALGPAGRHIWITEFEGSGTQAQQITFLQTVMPWLDAQSWIDRYAWFGVFDGNLVDVGTSGAEERSPLGKVFGPYYSSVVTIS